MAALQDVILATLFEKQLKLSVCDISNQSKSNLLKAKI
jgi:hypothetical protein